jgi:hypothetical protein
LTNNEARAVIGRPSASTVHVQQLVRAFWCAHWRNVNVVPSLFVPTASCVAQLFALHQWWISLHFGQQIA